MTDAIVFDIDGCFCVTDFIFKEIHKLGLRGKDMWDYFEANVHRCKVNDWAAQMVKSMGQKNVIVFLTARREVIREATYKMLTDNLDGCYCILKMRPNDNEDESAVYKRGKLDEIKAEYNVLFAVDDEHSNCQMFKEAGITTLKVL